MDLSVVIPVYNEVESLPHLHRAVHEALDGQPFSWEVVYVDDGSRDGSGKLLEQMAADDPEHAVAVLFKRNFGQTAAMAAGIDHAGGEVIALMDADLQNDPADIPMLLEKLAEGHSVVCGWRKERQDAVVTRKIPSQLANRLISKVTGVALHDYGCSLKVFQRDIITGFRLYGEMHRFIPVYAAAVGGKILEVPVRHHARQFGQTKYGLSRTVRVVLDLLTVRLLTRFATRPAHMIGGFGVNLILLGVLLGIISLIHGLVGSAGWPWPLLLGAMSVFAGLQTICIGLVAELLMRAYYESQDKRPYLVKRVVRGRAVHSTPQA